MNGLSPVRVALAFVLLGVLLALSVCEKVTPDSDDCAARGKGSQCWTEAYGD